MYMYMYTYSYMCTVHVHSLPSCTFQFYTCMYTWCTFSVMIVYSHMFSFMKMHLWEETTGGTYTCMHHTCTCMSTVHTCSNNAPNCDLRCVNFSIPFTKRLGIERNLSVCPVGAVSNTTTEKFSSFTRLSKEDSTCTQARGNSSIRTCTQCTLMLICILHV